MLDTALVLSARATTSLLLEAVERQVSALTRLVERHRRDPMAGRTLTQHAVPITFGLKAAQWLQGVLDARDDLRALRFPVQLGGAAGTLAAVTELAGDADAALFLVAETARILHLDRVPSWHTNRAPLTRYADALVRATDAMGHVANDVLLLARPEIAELAEPAVQGRGGSSTMPQKANPVLSVLIRRAAVAAPAHAATAAPRRGHHARRAPRRQLAHGVDGARRPVAAHAHRGLADSGELVEGLHVDTARMAGVVKEQASALLAERRSIRSLTDSRGTEAILGRLRPGALPRCDRRDHRRDPRTLTHAHEQETTEQEDP